MWFLFNISIFVQTPHGKDKQPDKAIRTIMASNQTIVPCFPCILPLAYLWQNKNLFLRNPRAYVLKSNTAIPQLKRMSIIYGSRWHFCNRGQFESGNLVEWKKLIGSSYSPLYIKRFTQGFLNYIAKYVSRTKHNCLLLHWEYNNETMNAPPPRALCSLDKQGLFRKCKTQFSKMFLIFSVHSRMPYHLPYVFFW